VITYLTPFRPVQTLSLLLLGFCGATAQTLQVPPVTMDRGSANILRITLKPDPARPLTALQWDLVYRSGLRIEPAGLVAGSIAESAGKVLTCGRKSAQGVNQRLTCILAGGIKVMSAGVIAIVRLEATGEAPKGKLLVDLENVVGVSPALEHVSIEGAQASVTIR